MSAPEILTSIHGRRFGISREGAVVAGGVLPGVTVTATQTATGQVRTTVTNETGDYQLQALPVGTYRVEFALQGFKSFIQNGLVLQVGGAPTLNAVLGVGALTETVQVEATAPLIETRACHYESSVNRNFIIDHLPGAENAWVAGVGQAEGFKFGPVVGEYIAMRVLGTNGDPELVKAFRMPTEEYET